MGPLAAGLIDEFLLSTLMLPRVDSKNASAVAAFVEQRFIALYPDAGPSWFPRLFDDVEALFAGRHPDYRAIDLRYHDLEHTLQATLCLTLLLEGRERSHASPALSSRQFQLSIAAVLLHDSGYLKLRSDTEGTGAKYTYCHVLRSCAFTASYLPKFGATDSEIAGVLGAISCTGPTKEISHLHFQNPLERFIGSALATADYLSQMAAADYPDELEPLFAEFSESDDFVNVPPAARMFNSPGDLVARTPTFWRKFVMPKLEKDFEGAYRFLATPFPHGPNPYLEAIERNIAIIEERIARVGTRTG